MSVCLSICPIWAPNSTTKWGRKTKVGVNVPHGGSNWSANFRFKGQRLGMQSAMHWVSTTARWMAAYHVTTGMTSSPVNCWSLFQLANTVEQSSVNSSVLKIVLAKLWAEIIRNEKFANSSYVKDNQDMTRMAQLWKFLLVTALEIMNIIVCHSVYRQNQYRKPCWGGHRGRLHPQARRKSRFKSKSHVNSTQWSGVLYSGWPHSRHSDISLTTCGTHAHVKWYS